MSIIRYAETAHGCMFPLWASEVSPDPTAAQLQMGWEDGGFNIHGFAYLQGFREWKILADAVFSIISC